MVSYEPNGMNRARLTENLRLNRVDNVIVRNLGVGPETGTATMVASPLMSGGATIESSAVEGLRSSNLPVVSSRFPSCGWMTIYAIRPCLRRISSRSISKELAALIGARETIGARRPRLFLEMHGETMNLKRKKVREIVAYIEELGYRDIRHVETGTRIAAGNSEVASEGHLYCVASAVERAKPAGELRRSRRR